MRSPESYNICLLKHSLIILLIAYSFAFPTFAQLNVKGVPHGLKPQIKTNLSTPEWVMLPDVNVQKLVEEDEKMDGITNVPFRFGENLFVSLSPKNSGKWDVLEDGSRLWRLGIMSKGALSLNLAFDQYHLPDGAKLYIYTPDGENVIGAFTAKNNQDDGFFATTLISGDMVIIEYFEPYYVAFPGELSLWRVTHGYRGPGKLLSKGFGDSGNCNVNVACFENPCWHQIRSVGMLVVGGNGFCSGALINNTRNNGIPYFLSADHCYKDPSTVVFWFNWQSETCQNPSQVPSHDAMSGAVTRARHSASDFWLLQLNQVIPGEYNVYFSGWNRTTANQMTGQVVGIHHPQGDIKKISWANGGVTRSNYGGNQNSGTTHWRVGAWNGGTTTERGSSGSPLFDPQGRIIGQLHGGRAACGNTLPDWYGRLGVSWTGGGTNSTRLSNWLDPLNSGVLTIDGFDPIRISGPNLVCNNETATFNLSSLPNGAAVTWSHNTTLFLDNVTGQGTQNYVVIARPNVRGEAWVRATISTPCGNTTIEKRIWIGRPHPPHGINFVPTPCACIGYGVDATVVANNTHLSGVNYVWNTNPFHTLWSLTENNSKVRFAINNSSAHNIDFSVYGSNSCGSSSAYNYRLYVNTCDCSHNPGENTGHLDVNPNPTRYSLNVSEKEPTNSNIPWVLRIMGQNGVVYIVVTSQLPETIDVSNLQPGIYILHARRGSYTEQHQIIVN
jgi:hypothetical protein